MVSKRINWRGNRGAQTQRTTSKPPRTNALFEPFEQNVCAPSEPLGTWTRKKNVEPKHNEEDDEE
jgi:hypothetical protein